ncbi:hypothetical protein [Mumia sp. DW29H23]|uniref:hypothetical protein n=1 Tax=Mumia sp. DW29H23 TaxID=3421241 RepID=UPI003D696109
MVDLADPALAPGTTAELVGRPDEPGDPGGEPTPPRVDRRELVPVRPGEEPPQPAPPTCGQLTRQLAGDRPVALQHRRTVVRTEQRLRPHEHPDLDVDRERAVGRHRRPGERLDGEVGDDLGDRAGISVGTSSGSLGVEALPHRHELRRRGVDRQRRHRVELAPQVHVPLLARPHRPLERRVRLALHDQPTSRRARAPRPELGEQRRQLRVDLRPSCRIQVDRLPAHGRDDRLVDEPVPEQLPGLGMVLEVARQPVRRLARRRGGLARHPDLREHRPAQLALVRGRACDLTTSHEKLGDGVDLGALRHPDHGLRDRHHLDGRCPHRDVAVVEPGDPLLGRLQRTVDPRSQVGDQPLGKSLAHAFDCSVRD